MKSLCAVLIAITLILPLVREVQAGAAIGALGGVTRMSWDGDAPDKGSYGNLMGFTAGGQIDIDIYRSTALSLQPSFTQKGTKMSFEVEGQSERVDSVEVRLDYFVLPLLVKVETLGGRFYVSGGFELGWLLSARYKTPTQDVDISADLNKYDLAADFGIGYTIPAGRTDIWFELRYSQSLVNVGEEDAGPEGKIIEPRVKNNGLLLLVGVLYDL
jgi:hypothetical protein